MLWLAGDIKEPTRLSQRVGHEVPAVVVWPFLLKRGLGWEMLRDISYHKATLQSKGRHSMHFISPSCFLKNWIAHLALPKLSCQSLQFLSLRRILDPSLYLHNLVLFSFVSILGSTIIYRQFWLSNKRWLCERNPCQWGGIWNSKIQSIV